MLSIWHFMSFCKVKERMNFNHFLYSKMVGDAQACYRTINTKSHPVLPKYSCLLFHPMLQIQNHSTSSFAYAIRYNWVLFYTIRLSTRRIYRYNCFPRVFFSIMTCYIFHAVQLYAKITQKLINKDLSQPIFIKLFVFWEEKKVPLTSACSLMLVSNYSLSHPLPSAFNFHYFLLMLHLFLISYLFLSVTVFSFFLA